MATKVITMDLCDACSVKGLETEAVDKLTIGEDEYDLCGTHAERFRKEFRKLFGSASSTQKIA